MRKHPVIACGCKACLAGAKRKEAFALANRKFRRLSKAGLQNGDYEHPIVSVGYTD